MTLRVAYDVTFPSQFLGQRESQTGVSRVVEAALRALCARDDVAMTAVGLMGSDRHPTRTSTAARAYHESRRLADAGCAVADAHRSRTGLLTRYADRLLARARAAAASEAAAAAGGAGGAVGVAPRGLPPAPVLWARRALSYAVALDAAQALAGGPYDVFHATFRPLPDRRLTGAAARVLTVHDLIPIHEPDAVPPGVRGQLEQSLASVDVRRDWAICISEHTRRAFCDFTGMPPARTSVVPWGVAGHFRPVSDPAVLAAARERYRIPPGPYVLSVSNPQPRKNLPTLVRAFYRLLRAGPAVGANLVLVGSRNLGWGHEAIAAAIDEAPDLRHRVAFTGYVDEPDLAAVYAGASAFAFPSTSEGFGLPPLEAMACGLPVLSADATSLPEVVGDAGVLLPPADADAWAAALGRVLADEPARRAMADRSLARAATFTWDRCAAETVAAYRAAVEARHG